MTHARLQAHTSTGLNPFFRRFRFFGTLLIVSEEDKLLEYYKLGVSRRLAKKACHVTQGFEITGHHRAAAATSALNDVLINFRQSFQPLGHTRTSACTVLSLLETAAEKFWQSAMFDQLHRQIG
ncbi:hypothetical protein D3C86_1849790 [compost metagenome]